MRNDPDLRELFLEEARERLERVMDLVGRVGADDSAAVGLRRELHALKGASRMMGFTEISKACHRAEDLAESDAAESRNALDACCRSIAAMVEAVSGSEDNVHETTAHAHPAPGAQARRQRGEDLRVPAGVIDRAKALLPKLQAHLADGLDMPKLAADALREANQMDLFAGDGVAAHITATLRQADLDTMTPLDALDLLRKLKDEL